jgi:hypothetical protein
MIKLDSAEEYLSKHEEEITEVESFLKKNIWIKNKDNVYQQWTGQLYENTDIPICIGDYVEISSEDLQDKTGILIKMNNDIFVVNYPSKNNSNNLSHRPRSVYERDQQISKNNNDKFDVRIECNVIWTDDLKPSNKEEYELTVWR